MDCYFSVCRASMFYTCLRGVIFSRVSAVKEKLFFDALSNIGNLPNFIIQKFVSVIFMEH